MRREFIKPRELRYQEAWKHFERGPGLVVMAECDICGYLDWRSTHTKEPDGYRIVPMEYCHRCEEVRQRSPEIFQWVINALAKTHVDIDPPSRGEEG